MSYTILGRKILNEYIAIGVYSAVGLGVYAAMSGPSKAVVATIPEANSSSTDESAFLREFMANLEREDAAAAKH